MSNSNIKTELDVTAILYLYSSRMPSTYEVLDNSRGENDKRFVIFCDYNDYGRVVIKAARNSFSTPSRVTAWADLAAHYNNLGIYAPQFLCLNSGNFGELKEGYCVWAEEYAKYLSSDKIAGEVNGEENRAARLKALGRIANSFKIKPIVSFSSPYAMYYKFSDEDSAPEIYANGLEIIRKICRIAPSFAERANSILKAYELRRAEFEPIYRALPKATFQGDMNLSNLLFDGEGKFKGVMDFNLSGTDAILAYAFFESHYIVDDDELEEVKNNISLGIMNIEKIEERTRSNLKFVSSEYNFSHNERTAFIHFYRLAAPFWNFNGEAYTSLLNNGGISVVKKILDYIEYHFNRTDVESWLSFRN